jgi:uncharacterized protein YgiM (DUF1202 family)
VGKIIRAVIGLIVLVVLLVVVNGWYSDYKETAAAKRSADALTTSTPVPPVPVAVAGQRKVTVLEDGLNLRKTPDTSGVVIHGLKKGDTLVLVATSGAWIQVKDAASKSGWVPNNNAYIQVQK